jgi:hypothetical protein
MDVGVSNVIDALDATVGGAGILDIVDVLDLTQKSPDLAGFSGFFTGQESLSLSLFPDSSIPQLANISSWFPGEQSMSLTTDSEVMDWLLVWT